MENFEHTMSDLFAQLGLANADIDVDKFIHQHRPIADELSLEKASFWNTGQTQFIHEALSEDSDWSELIDQLDTRLRA
ncbi:MAG TPA: DUF2789 domain-containing protein [Thiotrichaceae bacterium]|jgi:hypothetical protein|nr:DUF2789 domain-containing protein [Thiotrichaceae bacterium]HIM06943.1 DUF2789 domain-containing protein [Gammaproteobacteria bacterium]